MEIKKQNKFLKMMRKYGYYTFVGVLLVAIGLTLAFTLPNAGGNNVNLNPDESGEPVGTNPITFTLPMQGATIGMDFSSTELEFNKTLGEWSAHLAVDFIAGENDLVYAIADGTVTEIVTTYAGGTSITIEHKDGYKSVYKSLSNETKVNVGGKVSKGQEIGSASDSSNDESLEGKHLHFEMFKDGQKVNPNNYLDLEGK